MPAVHKLHFFIREKSLIAHAQMYSAWSLLHLRI